MIYFQVSSEVALQEMNSSIKGLSVNEAKVRLIAYGPNTLKDFKKKPAWKLFIGQFKDFMIFVLVTAAVISGLAGDVADTVIIFVIVLLNAITGFFQEYKAEKAIDALKKMAVTQAQVIRAGIHSVIPSVELVPGDIVLLEAGNTVPADIRLLETYNLNINESSLTGESIPVEKTSNALKKEDLSLGDCTNMAFKGTNVTLGRGTGLVVFTGMHTEIGKIAELLQTEESETPLKRRMTEFSKKLSYIIILICLILFVVGILRGEDTMKMLLLSISLAVAAIPEALPALITIALAKGASRLVKQQALIRKLPAVETLGSVSYICSDKTGTLTMNKMKVSIWKESDEKVLIDGNSPLLLGMSLNHDVKFNNESDLNGEPTETAIVAEAINALGYKQFQEILINYPREAEIPFDSDRKCMTTVHKMNEVFLLITKGAVESLLKILSNNEKHSYINHLNDQWSKEGLRVIAFGYKILDTLPADFDFMNIESDFNFAGLVGLIDPPREEVKEAIMECGLAGIRTVMITGDHPATASAVAREIGLLKKGNKVLSGLALERMDQATFLNEVEEISVYARVAPDQKLRIVKALQSKNHFVSMTGDGVNDAPSLRAANIGVAMGITGTDVSKEAAHMILLDDNFATIVKAVKEGRRIYDNIRKFIKYIMTCNSAEIWTIMLAPLFGMPIPLMPIQILWINLVTDGLPGIALASEKAESDIMNRPPRHADESLFAEGLGFHILWVGILMAGITLVTQAWALQTKSENWQTMVFTVLSLSQLGHALAIRSERTFLYKQGIFTNLPLLSIVFMTFLLQLAVIYLPFMNSLIHTQPLSIKELGLCIGLAAILFHAVEFEKWVKHRLKFRKSAE